MNTGGGLPISHRCVVISKHPGAAIKGWNKANVEQTIHSTHTRERGVPKSATNRLIPMYNGKKATISYNDYAVKINESIVRKQKV